MLRLKRIEMLGFKSFCDRTEMQFNGGGITAVVGPNGCGKSNISDAINWVLGEQSAKSLRGGSMQDVIFNGTRDRAPMGLSEVSLTLVQTDSSHHSNGHSNGHGSNGHDASSEATDLVITRRLFRSGESEYLLNGKIGRLRDIQEIFMGTGLGPESYAIIEQGRIGQILSSKPYDRRALIEEAAGVTKYKTKRRLAEAKLEGSKQNLNRVNDILEEVTRQVNSLKRQAAKARRYAELRDEFRARLRVALASRYNELERQAMQLAIELGMIGSRLKEQAAELEALETEQFQLNRAGYDHEDALRRQRETVAALALDADRARNRIAYQKQQIAELESRLREDESQWTQTAGRISALEEELAACRLAAELAISELASSQADVEALAAQLAQAEESLRLRENERDSLRASLLRLIGEISELRNQLAQVDEYLAGLERQWERADREASTAAVEESALRAQRRELLNRMEQQQLELQNVAAQRADVEARGAELKQDAAQTAARLAQLRDDLASVRARRDSLDQILSHRAYTAEAVKRLFAVNGDGDGYPADAGRLVGGTFKPLGILADFVEAEPQYEGLVEDCLAQELEYVVVKGWEAAHQGVHLLRTELEGRATFLVHPQQPRALPAKSNGLQSESVAPLKSFVRLTNGLADSPEALVPKLAACYVAETPEDARQFAEAYPELYFLTADGECFHGATLTGGKRAASGPLALKRELREVTQRASEFAAETDQCAATLRATEQEAERVSVALERLRKDEVEREKFAAASDQELKQLAVQLQRSGERLSVARLELERLDHERVRAAEHAASLRTDISARERWQQEMEARIVAATTAAVDLAAAREQASVALGAARARCAALEERRRAAEGALDRIDDSVRHERLRAAELERQLAFSRQELDRLTLDNEETVKIAGQAAEQRVRAEADAAAIQQAIDAGRQRLAALEDLIKAARTQLEEERERKSAGEVTLARQQSDLGHMDEDCRRELGVAVSELGIDPAEMASDDALVEVEEQVRQLRAKIDGLGAVNVMALEEFQEAQQRYEFLSTQRQDLLDAIRDTQQTIHEIDAISREKFNEAFEAINANFQESFRTLFGGGTGLMRLTEGDNPNEAGVDLIAQPPGKRLQNALLLSGGEKALTALALLLAIFRYQPSPFCVLDEVDAPLDDANIGRFTRLLQEMSLKTQFIIITHSKKTMEVAPVLYGVTMQEPGVSKLVSVKFHQPDAPPPIPVPSAEAVGAAV